jgi:hypothetical protein
MMSSAAKRRFHLRTVLSPSVAPKSKTITPAMEAELAKRQAEWEAKPQKAKK